MYFSELPSWLTYGASIQDSKEQLLLRDESQLSAVLQGKPHLPSFSTE